MEVEHGGAQFAQDLVAFRRRQTLLEPVDERGNVLTLLAKLAKKDFGRVHIERVRDTYPIYDLRYKESFALASRMVKPLANLKLLGRTGAYWYNNSDHSMKMSLSLARHLLEGAPMKEKEALFEV